MVAHDLRVLVAYVAIRNYTQSRAAKCAGKIVGQVSRLKIVIEFREKGGGTSTSPLDTHIIRTPVTSSWDSTDIVIEEQAGIWGITVIWAPGSTKPTGESEDELFAREQRLRVLEDVAASDKSEYLADLARQVNGIWVDGSPWFPRKAASTAERILGSKMQQKRAAAPAHMAEEESCREAVARKE